MKENTVTKYGIIFCLFFLADCKNQIVNPPSPNHKEKQWEVVPEFMNLDIRYMIQFNGELYAAVVNYQDDILYEGAVLKTADGNSWVLVKTFDESIGPMTVGGDSLYVNSDNFIHKMDKYGNWMIKFGVPWEIMETDYNGDMIFYNGELYVSQTILTGYLFKVTQDSVWTRLYPFPGDQNGPSCGRLVKVNKNGVELLYLRSTAITGEVFEYDGKVAKYLPEGLPKYYQGANSALLHNDTLIVGFKQLPSRTSGMLMYLDNNNVWRLYRDSLPNSPSAFYWRPPFTTLPTAIIYVGERMFVATETFGVLEWRHDKGWQTMNKGLQLMLGLPEEDGLYNTISFLEYFNGNLFVGYGDPAYMLGTVVSGPRKGLLKYRLD